MTDSIKGKRVDGSQVKNVHGIEEKTAPCGLLVIDKPQGFTSFDLCAKLRGILKQKHIGHTGTLDPMATGVMIVLLGRAARAAELIPDNSKRYTAGFRLGMTTDTLDITGNIITQREYHCDRAELINILSEFTGEISQLPPMYSAVHINGERLYKLARKGIEVERAPRKVTISKLVLTGFSEYSERAGNEAGSSEGTLDIECSRGTYIRSLIDDIGKRLGCGAVMTSLRRTYAMGFSEEQAYTLERIEELAAENRLCEAVMPVDSALAHLRKCMVSDNQARLYRNGGRLSLARLRGMNGADEGEFVRVYSNDGFIGVGKIVKTKEKIDENCELELAPHKSLS